MSPRAVILTLAALFAIAGLSFGLMTVHSGSTSCGSVLKPQTGTTKILDEFDDQDRTGSCHSAIGDRKPFVYGGLGLAALALIAGAAASGDKPTNADGSAKPSVWR